MLKMNQQEIDNLEQTYPGIRKTIDYFENLPIPACPHYGSDDTASVQVGFVGYLLAVVSATSKATMIPNGPRPGTYFCNQCRKYFG